MATIPSPKSPVNHLTMGTSPDFSRFSRGVLRAYPFPSGPYFISSIIFLPHFPSKLWPTLYTLEWEPTVCASQFTEPNITRSGCSTRNSPAVVSELPRAILTQIPLADHKTARIRNRYLKRAAYKTHIFPGRFAFKVHRELKKKQIGFRDLSNQVPYNIEVWFQVSRRTCMKIRPGSEKIQV